MTSALKILRHSAAQVLAVAVSSLFPKAQLVSGESTSLGFYYDFFFHEPITKEQIPFIEERMRDFMRQDMPFKLMEMMRKNAIELFKYHHQDLKVALLKANVETLVHVCQLGSFYDLAYPPFVETTKDIGVIKLLDISPLTLSLPGKPSLKLTRIQGTAFPTQRELKDFLKKNEAAKERDHRLLGKAMHLFESLEEACPGCWAWHSKGVLLRETLLDWWRAEHRRLGYQFVETPDLIRPQVIENQKHCSFSFKSDSTSYATGMSKALMHSALFKSKLHSYRELPIRYTECGDFYDPSKEVHLWGLLRARAFTVDKEHIFCDQEQVLDELISSLQFINKTVKIMGFEAHWYLMAKGQKFPKPLKKWDESLSSLVKALQACEFDYTLDNEPTDGYGPSIEARFVDALGREWKGPYVYMDLYHPDKLGLHYQSQDGGMRRPMMIGRSILGSIERLIAILVEHYSGYLPLWLAPEQMRVIPVIESNADYAAELHKIIELQGFRVGIDYRKENLGVKIHAAESEKVPYIIVIGETEEKNRTISLRSYPGGQREDGVFIDKWLEQLKAKIESKA